MACTHNHSTTCAPDSTISKNSDRCREMCDSPLTFRQTWREPRKNETSFMWSDLLELGQKIVCSCMTSSLMEKKKKLSGWKMVFRTFQLSQSDGQSNWTPDSWGWVSLVCRVQCSSQQSTYRKGTSLLDKGNKGAWARTAVNRKKLWMLMREIADNPCSDLSVNFIPC